ncbi:hypothetical protein BJ165DRAFT_1616443 [Panaeolus papilionaceus]|nr:hypothetical protein BJ165DRAFT_1616443 [Panaeolus papilionaceus]
MPAPKYHPPALTLPYQYTYPPSRPKLLLLSCLGIAPGSLEGKQVESLLHRCSVAFIPDGTLYPLEHPTRLFDFQSELARVLNLGDRHPDRERLLYLGTLWAIHHHRYRREKTSQSLRASGSNRASRRSARLGTHSLEC